MKLLNRFSCQPKEQQTEIIKASFDKNAEKIVD